MPILNSMANLTGLDRQAAMARCPHAPYVTVMVELKGVGGERLQRFSCGNAYVGGAKVMAASSPWTRPSIKCRSWGRGSTSVGRLARSKNGRRNRTALREGRWVRTGSSRHVGGLVSPLKSLRL